MWIAKTGEKKYVYMLNNTALPSPRVFIAILENYQTKDGKIDGAGGAAKIRGQEGDRVELRSGENPLS